MVWEKREDCTPTLVCAVVSASFQGDQVPSLSKATKTKTSAPKVSAPKKVAAKPKVKVPKAVAAKPKVTTPKTTKPKAGAAKATRARSRGTAKNGWRRKAKGTLIHHTCGHSQHHPLGKEKWKREREAKRLSEMPCTSCWSQAQAEEAEALCGIKDLPALTGTPRRVEWARSIRAIVLGRIQAQASIMDRSRKERGLAPVSEAFLGIVLATALDEKRASWWIDYRELLDDPADTFTHGTDRRLLETWREEASAPLIECPF